MNLLWILPTRSLWDLHTQTRFSTYHNFTYHRHEIKDLTRSMASIFGFMEMFKRKGRLKEVRKWVNRIFIMPLSSKYKVTKCFLLHKNFIGSKMCKGKENNKIKACFIVITSERRIKALGVKLLRRKAQAHSFPKQGAKKSL